MSEAPKVIWVWPHEDRGWYSAGASDEVNLGLLGKQADLQAKYHHDDTVTALQAKVARLEAALERVRRISQKGGMSTGLRMQTMDTVARNALRAIALDTTTATCDNKREGE